jgi:hypothetical protein
MSWSVDSLQATRIVKIVVLEFELEYVMPDEQASRVAMEIAGSFGMRHKIRAIRSSPGYDDSYAI